MITKTLKLIHLWLDSTPKKYFVHKKNELNFHILKCHLQKLDDNLEIIDKKTLSSPYVAEIFNTEKFDTFTEWYEVN